MALLEVKNVKKIYTTRFGGNQVEALKNVSFSVEPGEYVAIMGESGSGKTTLLNILAALDQPTAGRVYLKGNDIGKVKEKEMAAFRRQNLGFVFQDFNLLDTFSLRDNIFLPLVLSGKKYEEMDRRLQPIAQQLGIREILGKFPYEVSGGQKQRAAVARAIITKPQLILADEPTGALDSRCCRRTSGDVHADQQRRTDHPHGDSQCEGGQHGGESPLHQGRGGVPPDLQRKPDKRTALPEDFGHTDRSGYGR